MFTDQSAVLRAVRSQFADGRVLVVGDVMLDCYVWGEVARISPEAPVPVVRVSKRSRAMGGAANVAANLAGLGIRTSLVSVVGSDAEGASLKHMLEEAHVEVAALLTIGERPTITKTRILGGNQQMIRLDEEDCDPLSRPREDALIEAVVERLQGADVMILSDYAKGVLSPRCCRSLIAAASSFDVRVLVDPKGVDYSKYAGADVITPNARELAAVAGLAETRREALYESAMHLADRYQIGHWAVTQGERGISLVHAGKVSHFPAVAREVYDVSGAGDTVIAVVAAAIAAGIQTDDALRLANLAAGVVVGKVGTAPIAASELLAAIELKQLADQTGKIVTPEVLLRKVAQWRGRGERIVFTNGCFDILHVGHVTYLEKAREEGHRLIVGLNADRSVQLLKGPDRPIVPELDRARVLASLASVDAVVIFDAETPIDLINLVRPDAIVKGDDYAVHEVVGAKEVMGWGGDVVLIPRVEGRSTTDILGRILAQA